MATFWLAAGCGVFEPSAREQPNILLVTLDTTRADVLGAYGDTLGVSPHIDALAAQGVVFENAFTVTPLTIPAHASLMTGLLPPQHGVRDNGDYFLSDSAETLAERLSSEGYATGAAVGAEVTSQHWGFGQGFDAYFDQMSSGTEQENRWRVERRGDLVVKDAKGWLDTQKGGEHAWFLWVHLFDAHHPYQAPSPYGERFEGRPYRAEVAYVDALVGDLYEQLKANGTLHNTWIVIVADHGESLGQHGESTHGTLIYGPTMRIPLIVVPPGGRSPVRVANPVSLVDVAPTILYWANAAPFRHADGLSLGDWLQGAAPPHNQKPRPIYMESLYAWRHYGWAQQYGLITKSHTFIDGGRKELFALEDLNNVNDIAASQSSLVHEISLDLAKKRAALDGLDVSSSAENHEELNEQLEALGYITTVVGQDEDVDNSILPHPADKAHILGSLERIRMAFQKGEGERVRAQLEKLILLEPGLSEPRVMLAGLYADDGESERALKLLQETEDRGGSAQIDLMRATIHLGRAEPQQATSLLETILKRDPALAKAWRMLLHTRVYAGEMEQLAKEVRTARELLPSDPVVQCMYGVVLASEGVEDNVEALLRGGLERQSMQPFCRVSLGGLLTRQGKEQQAVELYEEEISLFPPALNARQALVSLYATQRLHEKQLSQLREIQSIEPGSFLTSHSAAQALYNLERYEDAWAEVEQCRKLAPRYPACVMLAANILKRRGKSAQAQKTYEEALRLAERDGG